MINMPLSIKNIACGRWAQHKFVLKLTITCFFPSIEWWFRNIPNNVCCLGLLLSVYRYDFRSLPTSHLFTMYNKSMSTNDLVYDNLKFGITVGKPYNGYPYEWVIAKKMLEIQKAKQKHDSLHTSCCRKYSCILRSYLESKFINV